MTNKERPLDAQPDKLPKDEETAQQVQEDTAKSEPSAEESAQETQEVPNEQKPGPEAITVDTEGIKDFSDMTPEEWEQWRAHLPEFREQMLKAMEPLIKVSSLSEELQAAIPNLSQEIKAAIPDYSKMIQAAMPAIRSTSKLLQKDVIKGLAESMKFFSEAASRALAMYYSDAFKGLEDSLSGFAEWAEKQTEDMAKEIRERDSKFSEGDIEFLTEFRDGIEELLPFIKEELKTIQQERGGEQLTFSEFMADEDPETGEPIQSIFELCIERAKERKETADAATRLAADLPRLQSVFPAKHTMPNTYLSNQLINLIGMGEQNLPSLGTGKRAKKNGEIVTTKVMVDYQQGKGVAIEGNTEYDRQVQDAVYSLYEYGDESHMFTSAMLYRAMTGNTTVQPSPQQVGAVTKSVEKHWFTPCTIDASEEFAKRGITGADGKPIRYRKTAPIFDLEKHEFTVPQGKGKAAKTTVVYKIVSEPILLEYARLTGQRLTVNSGLLDIKRIDKDGVAHESLNNSNARISLKGILLRRIEVLKHDRKEAKAKLRSYNSRRRKDPSLQEKKESNFYEQSSHVLFTPLFECAGLEGASRKVQLTYREYVFACLDYWKAAGHIKGYTKLKGEKNAIKGIDIQV